MFGESEQQTENQQKIGMAVSAKPSGEIELMLMEQELIGMNDAGVSPLFLDDEGRLERQSADELAVEYGRPVTLVEAFAIRDLLADEVAERFAMQFEIARALPPYCTIERYREVCRELNIEAII